MTENISQLIIHQNSSVMSELSNTRRWHDPYHLRCLFAKLILLNTIDILNLVNQLFHIVFDVGHGIAISAPKSKLKIRYKICKNLVFGAACCTRLVQKESIE